MTIEALDHYDKAAATSKGWFFFVALSLFISVKSKVVAGGRLCQGECHYSLCHFS